MATRGGDVPQVFEKPENRLALADELIRTEVMASRAEREGLLKDPVIRAEVRQLLVEHLERRLLERDGAAWRPSSNDLARAYEADTNHYVIPAGIRVAVVFLSAAGTSPEKRAVLRARAEQARVEAVTLPPAVPHFGPVAARYSDDQSTRYIGGDCGWEHSGRADFRWPGLEPALDGLAETGQVSGVIESADGFFLLKLMERRGTVRLPFGQVRRNLERDLALRRKQEILDRAYAEARQAVRVAVDEDVMRSLPAPRGPARTLPSNPSDE